MLKNHLKTAWRSLKKHRLQTLINLIGLTVGTLCCLLILAYVNAQFGYDQHHDDAASLFRIRTKLKTLKNTSIDTDIATSSPPIAFALKEDFPEVMEACRLVYFGEGSEQLIRVSGETEGYYEPRGYLADSTFFKLFKYPMLEGVAEGALDAPNSIVLSASLAKKLFGQKHALNSVLVLGDGEQQLDVVVTGVFKENEAKSHLNPNYLLSMASPGLGEYVRGIDNFATQNFAHAYVRLVPGANAKGLEEKLQGFLQRRGSQDLSALGFEKKLLLQPVTDIHLHSKDIKNQIEEVSNIEYLYSMLLLAFIIQIVACINFINLSTARASRRSKEIGVRKAIGANKRSLVHQFLAESITLSLGAVVLSIPLAIFLMPSMGILTKNELILPDLFNSRILIVLFLLGLGTGLLAGIYPALILSSFNPAKVLKGRLQIGSQGTYLRKTLVVFQFVVSIILVTAVIIITQQLKYAQKKDMGYDKENLLAIRLGTDALRSNYTVIQEAMASTPGVLEVSGSDHYPSLPILGDLGLHLPGEDDSNQTLVFYNGISENYFETVGTQLIAGRNLNTQDSTQIIVNEATLAEFGIPLEEALSSKLVQTYEGERTTYEIVGVSENYHFASIKSEIDPILLYNDTNPNWIILKTQAQSQEALLKALKEAWKSTKVDAPFIFTFIDKEVEKLYAEEKRLSQISLVFTILAIFISCLGLFGLVSYFAEQKKKEIGIRKVLGANINSVIKLLTADFVKLVGIAFLIAIPVSYYIIQLWLQDFSYHIDIEWWVFALSGSFAMMITLLTVGFQSLKSAMANPIHSLRTE